MPERKLTCFENETVTMVLLLHEALREDSAQYRDLMRAQNALLADGVEKLPLHEMQSRLFTLQKTSLRYMEESVARGNVVGVPRREAQLVYAAALHRFAQQYSLQLNEAMRCRDLQSLNLPGSVAGDYIKNSITALDMMVQQQTGVDPAQLKKKEPVRTLAPEPGRNR